jgi:SPP1 family predicted phage head-tail adaptor
MQSGKLRHRMTLQRRAVTRNRDGDVLQKWVDVAKPWAAVEPVSGREFIAAAASQSKVSTRITIRYRAGVNHDMRILHRDRIYNIEAVLPDKVSGLEYLTLMCSEGVNRG